MAGQGCNKLVSYRINAIEVKQSSISCNNIPIKFAVQTI